MTLLRGKGTGLEITLAGRDAAATLEELATILHARPGFYRGTDATLACGDQAPSDALLAAAGELLNEAGIVLRALSGGPAVSPAAAARGLAFVPARSSPDGELERRRALRPKREVALSEAARSLIADFAGARSDIASRRRRGEPSVPRVVAPVRGPTGEAPLSLVESPATRYHVGTLRGGQSLHQLGNLVVVGDVNPGAELVATGDILVFGRLAGVAHAGAQGDAGAVVLALDLAATQLRIATSIAADAPPAKRSPQPEVAIVREAQIMIIPYDRWEPSREEADQ
ncbi:MAG: septum site-determining protein MinC [Vulcanimicrobiaceae bacterium]